MEREPSYIVRYGLMGQVGRFTADAGTPYGRGDRVVVRSHRGTELGEILLPAPVTPPDELTLVEGLARILRPASAEDHARAERADRERDDLFARCSPVLADGRWPLELLDVEPLLDEDRVVLHYLGPHRIEVAELLAAFRREIGRDVLFQAMGRDEEEEVEVEDAEHAHGCGTGCGSGGCGSEGGCGTSTGCGSCSVKDLLAAARR